MKEKFIVQVDWRSDVAPDCTTWDRHDDAIAYARDRDCNRDADGDGIARIRVINQLGHVFYDSSDRVKLGLCGPGRHDIPGVSGFVFPADVDPLDTDGLSKHAAKALCDAGLCEAGSLDLYVTGLSVALVAVVNACCERGIPLTVWHYNRDTGSYYPQPVSTRVDAELAAEAYGGYARRRAS